MAEYKADVSKPSYWRLLELSGAIIFASCIGIFVCVLHNPEWHAHLLRISGRAWDVFVAQDVGSTSRGFTSALMEAIFGIAAVAAMTGYFLGWAELKKHWFETVIIALFALPTITFAVYGTQFAWEVARIGYEDHKGLAAKVATLEGDKLRMVDPADRDSTIINLRKQLGETQSQLEIRKQMFVIGDPAFDNIRKILAAFQGYRIAAKGRRCFVYITSPVPSPIVANISELSNSVSGCFTSGLDEHVSRVASEAAKSGMISGVILIHASKGDSGADRVEEALSGILPLERSYTPFPDEIPHYQNQEKDDLVLWLQFGPDVKWTSEVQGRK